MNHIVATIFIHIGAPIGIGIAGQLAYQEVAQKGVEVEIGLPVALHLVEVLADVVELLGGDGIVVGRLDGDGIALGRGEHRGLVVGIGIDLDEISACEGLASNIFGRHLGNLYATCLDLYLVAQLIAAFVFAIEQSGGYGAVCVGDYRDSGAGGTKADGTEFWQI